MCVNITDVLQDNGHFVTLCVSRAGGALEKLVNPDANYYVLYKRNALDIFAFSRFISIIRNRGIELIHAHSSSLFWAIAAKLITKHIKVIWHDHLGLKVTDRRAKFMYATVSPVIDAIITVNHELAAWSRLHMKVQPERIIMINNFPLLKISKRQPNHELFIVVCLANLRPQKDHETLVRAVALLKEKELPKKLKVILAGSEDDLIYSSILRNLIKDLSLEHIIDMWGSVEDTSSLLSMADCGVLSSLSEGLPVALLEYGLASLPVVVTDVGECAEVVGYGKYARLTSAGDADGLANQLLWVINNCEEARIMGEKFKDHVVKEYGPEKFMSKYEVILNVITAR